MSRYICIHGHFYQPPRENPWLEEIEFQESAYPYHDWNHRIAAECYAPNTAARILNPEKRITDITNNYSRISFNFGPSLLSWLERHDPQTYAAVLAADEKSREEFSGHGSALAQCYNHLIMPLANSRDKATQVVWGLRDFEHRFKRKAEGMWLPETAADLETLEIFADRGIQFTILSPYQAKAVRKIGEEAWQDASGGRIDPRRVYQCRLPSGRTISLFFYDGPISRDIAFGDLLDSGENFANRLLHGFLNEEGPQLVHVSTDGETYGHHHYRGDMALAFALNYIDARPDVKLTNYGEFLAQHPAVYEVMIHENSSWSCSHGVERWRNNCGCNSGLHPGWSQHWRTPLREAMDWLREQLLKIYNEKGAEYLRDPHQARNAYIDILLNRSQDATARFLQKYALRNLTETEKIQCLKLLEMQRHAMLMYTSCGWFFDDISGIETVQILRYASRAMQLAKEMTDVPLEEMYVNILQRAPSNNPKYANGASLYEKEVRPFSLDLVKVGAHYAVASLFEEYSDKTPIYSYTVTNKLYERLESGKEKLAVGKAVIRSNITWEEAVVSFAVLHLGEHHLFGGVQALRDEKNFLRMYKEIKDFFKKDNMLGAERLIERHFGEGRYSLQHLFKDEQSKVLYQILGATLEEIKLSLRQINEYHAPIIEVVKELHIPLPKVLANTVSVMLNTDLLQVLGEDPLDLGRLEDLVKETIEWSLEIDKLTLGFAVKRKVNDIMERLAHRPLRIAHLRSADAILEILKPLALEFDLWQAQNIYFSVGKKYYDPMKRRAAKGNPRAILWVDSFQSLGRHLMVQVA